MNKYKAQELGESAYIAYTMSKNNHYGSFTELDWDGLNAASRRAWVAAAVAVAHMVDPKPVSP